jgi:nitroreductase
LRIVHRVGAPRFDPLAFERLPEDEMRRRSAAFLERARTRRTVRHFSTDPVPLEVVEAAIAAAATAPSGANQQPWTFVAVTDPDLKRRIRAAAEEEERRSYEGRMSDEWLAALEPLGTDWRKPHLTDAPVVIVVFEQAYGLREDGSKVKHYYAGASASRASIRSSKRRLISSPVASRSYRTRRGGSLTTRTESSRSPWQRAYAAASSRGLSRSRLRKSGTAALLARPRCRGNPVRERKGRTLRQTPVAQLQGLHDHGLQSRPDRTK